ncbi:uncharacterized protein A1O5_00823 [Cladophialophora psammophila CBS 110553]|uniref:Uncharacterized protein n=1 Tax=Cladophialophora psammophila CBS 110553 TaxID=1182543 RepID=W9XG31_9EURO|nr:uncharacterized protein A1O5_00823 [Cladophialophora psammophila CBS 110553]EXJ76315.1 hypothetical protein A1O5_00823 [Cladophialophora psammophila CBS 110553]
MSAATLRTQDFVAGQDPPPIRLIPEHTTTNGIESGRTESSICLQSCCIIQQCAIKRHAAVVQKLLSTGNVDVNCQDRYGRTALWWAPRNRHEAVVNLLLEADNADINHRDTKYNRTPLEWATENGHDAVIKAQVEHVEENAYSKVLEHKRPARSKMKVSDMDSEEEDTELH